MVDCTYRDLTQLKNKDAFRLATINTRLVRLTDCIERDREKLTKKRKRHKKLVGANVILTGIGVALSTAGGALSGTEVGVMVGGPAIGLGALCRLGAMITLRLCKTSNHELYQQLVTLGQAKLSFLQKLVTSRGDRDLDSSSSPSTLSATSILLKHVRGSAPYNPHRKEGFLRAKPLGR